MLYNYGGIIIIEYHESMLQVDDIHEGQMSIWNLHIPSIKLN